MSTLLPVGGYGPAPKPDPALPKSGRSKMGPVSKERARLGAARRRAEKALYAKNPRCARCGEHRELGDGLHGHERVNRSHGGDWLNPDTLLCDRCNCWAEDNPAEACWEGWKVSPKWPHDPALESNQARDLQGRLVIFSPPSLPE